MANHDPRAFLDDIIDAIAVLRRLAEGVTLEAYRGDEPLRWAVERGLEIVSEASRHVPSDAKARHPHLAWRQIANIAERLRGGCRRSTMRSSGRSCTTSWWHSMLPCGRFGRSWSSCGHDAFRRTATQLRRSGRPGFAPVAFDRSTQGDGPRCRVLPPGPGVEPEGGGRVEWMTAPASATMRVRNGSLP